MFDTLSIISGKGGSGKTSLAILLSQLFASCGYRVLLVDCDMSTHGATYFFEGMLDQKEKYYTFSNILYGNTSEQQYYPKILQVSSKIGFIPSCVDFSSKKKQGDIKTISILRSFLNEIEKQKYNIVIFDCQAGYSIETEIVLNISKTNLAVIEADAISATALRVLYAQLSKQLDNGRTYQVFNKISKEEHEIYSKLTHGTFFTNITPILFDWNVRKAFVTNELPEINTSNSILATSIYELALVLFPQYKDALREFILNIKQKKTALLEKELKIIKFNSRNDFLNSKLIPIFGIICSISFGLYSYFFPRIFSDNLMTLLTTVPFVICMLFFLNLLIIKSRNSDHQKKMFSIEKEQEQLKEEISQLTLKLNQ